MHGCVNEGSRENVIGLIEDRTMQFVRMHLKAWLVVAVAALVLGGCTAEQLAWMENWGQPTGRDKTVTRGKKPSQKRQRSAPRVAKTESKTDSEKPGDPESEQASDVNDRVDRYVHSMESDKNSSYRGNDFNDKIRRQEDPNRENRIRRTAEMSRQDRSEDKPAQQQDDRIQVSRADSPKPDGSRTDVAQQPAATEEKPLQAPARKLQGVEETTPSQVADAGEEAKEPVATPSALTGDPSAGNPSAADRSTAGKVSTNAPASIGDNDTAQALATPKTQAPSRPPVLTDVQVSAGQEEADVKPAADDVSAVAPVVTPVVPVDTFAKRLADQEALVAKEPNNLKEQFNLRMMYLIDGQDEKALASTEGIDHELQEIMQAQIKAMIAARSTAGRDPATWATRQQEALEQLNTLLKSRADLRVPTVVLCRAIERFGNYEPIEPLVFPTGRKNRVLVYVEVENFHSEKIPSGKYRSLMSARLSLLNKAGEELWSTRTDNFEDYSLRPRRDFFFHYGPLAIPKTLPPGEFVLKVEVEDVLAGKINSKTVKFKMVIQ